MTDAPDAPATPDPERFALHPRLAADSLDVGELALCTVRLMNDARFPWVLLVPRRMDAREPWDLAPADYHQLWDESAALGRAMRALYRASKMNVAAIGNKVPQLHLHHVARVETDAAWPEPIWGVGTAEPYGDRGPAAVAALRRALGL